MKAFRKGNSLREFHQSFRSQSAMEYLMTYGWAILIIAVVLAALFELGVFNPMTFAPKTSPGSCQVMRPEGAGTTNFISLEGECNGELPQYVAAFSNQPSQVIISYTFPQLYLHSYTVSAWVNWNQGVNVAPISCAQVLISYLPTWTTGNIIGMYSCSDHWFYDGGAENLECSAGPVNNRWYLFMINFNATNKYQSIWIDGALNCSQTLSVVLSANTPLAIGGGQSTWNNFPSYASISNVQIYNTSLSVNDIKALYQEGIGGAPIKIQSLVAWYPLNGNSDDYSGNNNNGVPNGVTYTSNWYSGYSAP